MRTYTYSCTCVNIHTPRVHVCTWEYTSHTCLEAYILHLWINAFGQTCTLSDAFCDDIRIQHAYNMHTTAAMIVGYLFWICRRSFRRTNFNDFRVSIYILVKSRLKSRLTCLQAHVMTCLQPHVMTCLQAHVMTCLQAHVHEPMYLSLIYLLLYLHSSWCINQHICMW